MAIATTMNGEESMGYETKVFFAAIADIIRTSKTLDEALARVASLANAEGEVIKLTPSEKANSKKKTSN